MLLAKSAFAAAPVDDMRRLARLVQQRSPDIVVSFGFSEQGGPSLREALLELRRRAVADIRILPLLVPLEPSLHRWLRSAVSRWQAETPGNWPPIRIARAIGENERFAELIENIIGDPDRTEAAARATVRHGSGSLIPPQKRRVLVCQGPDCNARGATALWGHLRNVQERRRLRVEGEGTMTAMSTCLGPCNLAPVLQVFPEGTYYCGVTEAAIDRIAEDHLLGGRVVEAFAYHPTGKKQALRS